MSGRACSQSAALALGLLFGRSGLRRGRAAFASRRWQLVLAGAGVGSCQALYFVGVQSVGVSVSTLVSLGTAPVAITLGAAVARRGVPPRASIAMLVAAITGLALISLRPGDGGHAAQPLLGVLASLGSGLGYCAHHRAQ